MRKTNSEHPLEAEIKWTLLTEAGVEAGDRILVAVSGGVDSIALLHALQRLAPELEIKLYVAHFNHGWRGREATNDARFVKSICRQIKIPFVYEKFERSKAGRKGGREGRARDARYDFLERTSRKKRCSRIAVAHNRDDLVETVLINFLRGSGPKGLSAFGLKSSRGDLEIIRPLIHVPRAAIEEYCRDRRLRWREDRTNKDRSLLRNRIRHELLPLMEDSYNPRIREALFRLASIISEDEAWAEREALRAYAKWHRKSPGKTPERVTLRCVLEQPLALVRRCVRIWLTELRPGHYPPPLSAVEGLIHFARNVETGGLLHTIDSLVFRKTRRHIELISRTPGRRVARKPKRKTK